ncbi:MAG: hypothetical protein M1378_00795 [Bacteroidetes bacterium]|nr:hypothetical protein [Bacteroidota bacterium]
MNQHQNQIGKQIALNVYAKFEDSGNVQGKIAVSGLSENVELDRTFTAKTHFEGNFHAVKEAVRYIAENKSQVRGYHVAVFTNAVTNRLLTEDNLHTAELLRIRNEIAEALAGLDADDIHVSFHARPAKKFGEGDDSIMNREGANDFHKDEGQPTSRFFKFLKRN